MINENLKQLYSDLQREYDLILDRERILQVKESKLIALRV